MLVLPTLATTGVGSAVDLHLNVTLAARGQRAQLGLPLGGHRREQRERVEREAEMRTLAAELRARSRCAGSA